MLSLEQWLLSRQQKYRKRIDKLEDKDYDRLAAIYKCEELDEILRYIRLTQQKDNV